MNCECVSKIDAQLKEENRALNGKSLIFDRNAGQIGVKLVIDTHWIDLKKAPRGLKQHPGTILANYCPFCGKETEFAPVDKSTDQSTKTV